MIPAVCTHRPPAMRVSRNPLAPPEAMQVVPVGVTIRSLQPEATGLLVCLLNGDPLPRLTARQRQTFERCLAKDPQAAQQYLAKAAKRALNWQTVRTRPGDVIEWHDQPQDKETIRSVLAIAAVVLNVLYPGSGYALAALFANIAYNLVVPPTVAERQTEEAAKDVFSTSLNGNTARLDQPIWRNFGRVKITPPFAALPYYEYRDNDGDDLDNQQIYYAVFAVGIDEHELETALIGRTPISHFRDVIRATYLAPGVQPAIAKCNVVTSAEVSTALEMESGLYVGGYAACQPQRRAGAIGIDVSCPQGLGKSGPLTVSFRVEVRDINDFGTAVTPWRIIGNESHTADTNTLQRWSHLYQIAPVTVNPFDGSFSVTQGTGTRVEVRVARTDLKDTDSTARHSLQWIGLRCYLDEPAPLDPDTAHYEVVMRASEQLSNASQHDFSLIVWPLVRTWTPATAGSPSGWGPKVRTRNPAWALADLWTNPVWGEGLADSRVDLQGLYDWSLTCDERQDRFDYSFATSLNAWDAGQLIARAGRARVFRRYGVKTLARDEWFDLPVTALTPRNTIADSMVINEKLPRSDSPDGIVVEYISNITWDKAYIECPCPGYSVSDPADPRYDADLPAMANPVFKTYAGITGAKHAEREGLYDAADMLLRNRTTACTTEMQGVITTFMMPVLFQPDIAGYGQSGDVAFWDEDTLVVGLTEKPDFGISGSTFLTLVRDDGSLTDPVLVTPGPTAWDVTLPAAPDFELVLDDGTRERPRFILGDTDLLMKVSAISDGGKSDAGDGEVGAQLYAITGVVDDERVHTADRHLLPGPGEIQDAIEPGVDDGGGGVAAIPAIPYSTIQSGDYASGGGISVTLAMNNDGTMTATAEFSGVDPELFQALPATEWAWTPPSYTGQWVLRAPIELTDAATFEVYASIDDPAFVPAITAGSALDTWLSLDATRTWTSDAADWPLAYSSFDHLYVPLRLRIRRIGSDIIEADQIIYLLVCIADISLQN